MAEQLHALAIGSQLSVDAMAAHLEDFLRQQGYSEPLATYDPAGQYLNFDLHARVDGGSWLLLDEQKRSRLGWAKDLARHLGGALDVFEISALDNPVRNQDGELGYEVNCRGWSIDAEGSTGPPNLPFDDDPELLHRAHGDFYETVSFVLGSVIAGALPPKPGEAKRLDFYRPAPQSPLPKRLEGIVAAIEESTEVSLVEFEGNPFLRLNLREGGSRMARVDAEELDLLRGVVGSKIPDP